MKTGFIAIALVLGITACGGAQQKDNQTKAIKTRTQAAANGDKDVMAELEKQARKKANAEKQKIKTAAKDGDTLAVFQKALMSEKGSADAVKKLARNGNPNALLWVAVSTRSRSNLSGADRKKMANDLVETAKTENAYKYGTFSNKNYPLSAEAAFQISEDKLHNNWLFKTDIKGALAYLEQAAKAGHDSAMFKLANRYQYGLDMEKDMATAKMWMEKSAKAGNHEAMRALKNMKK